MAKYDVVFSCGHTDTVELFGPEKERRRKIEYLEESCICSGCQAKRREERRKAAAKKAEELGLPELTGSPKQVEWAEEIREHLVDMLVDSEGNVLFYRNWEPHYRHHVENMIRHGKMVDADMDFIDRVVANPTVAFKYETYAGYYIDAFGDCVWVAGDRPVAGGDVLFKFLDKQCVNEKKFISSMQPEAIAYEAEITVEPENMEYDTLVTVYKPDGYNCVSVKSDYDKQLIEFVKSRGYKWDGKDKEWFKNMKDTDGAYEDRIAEIGNALLNAGWPVRIPDSAARDKAVNGTYEPRYPRWIVKGKSDDRLYIQWDNDNNDMTKKVEKFAKYDRYKDYYYLPVSHSVEILEFAELNDFRITSEAKDRINTYINSRVKVEVKDGAKVEMKSEEEKLKDILETKPEVLSHLMEDDVDDD